MFFLADVSQPEAEDLVQAVVLWDDYGWPFLLNVPGEGRDAVLCYEPADDVVRPHTVSEFVLLEQLSVNVGRAVVLSGLPGNAGREGLVSAIEAQFGCSVSVDTDSPGPGVATIEKLRRYKSSLACVRPVPSGLPYLLYSGADGLYLCVRWFEGRLFPWLNPSDSPEIVFADMQYGWQPWWQAVYIGGSDDTFVSLDQVNSVEDVMQLFADAGYPLRGVIQCDEGFGSGDGRGVQWVLQI